MSFLIAAPEFIDAAAADLANLGSMIGSANNAVAAATMGILPAAADEVSAEIAALFSSHAVGYQQLSAQAAAFHELFVQNLAAGTGAYAAAEANVVQSLVSAAPTLGIDLSGGLAGLGASISANLAGLGASVNAALSASFGGSLSGLAPLGAAIATDLNGGLSALAQTGGTLATNIGSGISGLTGGFNAALPGLQASLNGGLSGLNASLNAALSGGLSAGLSGLGPLGASLAAGFGNGLSGLLQAGNAFAANLGTALSGVGLSLALPGLTAALSGGLSGLNASLNAALSAGLGGSLSGLGPLGAALAADISSGLNGLAQTGGALATNLGNLAGGFTAGFPGLQASLTGGLSGLNAALNAALSGGFGGSLSGLGAGLSGLLQTGGSLFGNLPALTAGLTLPTSLNAALSAVGGFFGLTPSLGANIMAGLSGLGASLSLTLNGALTVGLPGLPALLANAIAPFQALLTAPSPAALLAQLQLMETSFNTGLINAEVNLNSALVAQEAGLELALFGNLNNGVLNSTFNFWNLLLGGGEAALNSLIGAPVPVGLTASLLVGPLGSGVIGGGALGGLLAAVPTKFLFDLNAVSAVVGTLTGNASIGAGLNAAITAAGLQASLTAMLNGSLIGGLPNLGASLVAAPVAGLQQIGTLETGFFNNLVTAETGFNNNLLANELAFETTYLGPNALNGAVNRFFNVGNLVISTGEQTLNGLLGGAQVPPLFLTGSSLQVFNGGNIGGLEGIFDQSLAAGFDLAGLL